MLCFHPGIIDLYHESKHTQTGRHKHVPEQLCCVLILQVDRHEELLRSCLRAVDALNRLPGSEASGPFTAFLKRTVMSGQLRDKFLMVQQERQEAEGEAMDVA
eukprot:GHRR01017439.1.p1 GENE.GHRR01017439.1~~GHRR01017439.1.p1  ORF type:complete len:103 (+),score=32.07 GHRR01017439.1:141-449(+)